MTNFGAAVFAYNERQNFIYFLNTSASFGCSDAWVGDISGTPVVLCHQEY